MNSNLEKCIAETTRRLNKPGLLLVSINKDGRANVMTIGWGLLGFFWGMPVFTVAVRPSRYTHGLIEERNEFTVNVPEDGMDDIVEYCGEVSGREHDKFKECKMDVLKAKMVNVPIIEQCKIYYECQVVHKLNVNPKMVPTRVSKVFYPNDDHHTLFFGKVLTVYSRG
jgi:flavin reductase (DIM6/NTAB) family NADH-FMN oxidoreductase RutF